MSPASTRAAGSAPSRTPEQRAEALARALASRQERARLRMALHGREISPIDVIEGSTTNPLWAALRVTWLLESVPGIGPVRAARIMETVGVASTRRLQGLGMRQRAALIDVLEGSSHA